VLRATGLVEQYRRLRAEGADLPRLRRESRARLRPAARARAGLL